MSKPTSPTVSESIRPYSDEELDLSDEMHAKLERLMEFFDLHNIPYDKFNPNDIPKLDLTKRHAYPNNDAFMHMPGQHNTQKWLQAISDIYRKEKSGEPRVKAIRSIIGSWNVMEAYDFLNWVKFHEAGDHMKYKFAQLWYENDALGPGYFLQVKKDPAPEPEPKVQGQDVDFARDRAAKDEERRAVIEKARNKIIGRLDSAEKLLRSPDGHIFSGKEFETLLEAIYQLKKKIQMVNKISSSTRLYEDLIVREANVLAKRGFADAADMLYSLADAPPPPAPPGDPSGAGNPGPPSGGAATPAQPPGNATMPQSPPNDTQPKGIKGFLENMDDGQYAPDEDSKADDSLEVEDPSLEVFDAEDSLMVSEAQVAPTPEPDPITTSPSPAPLDPAKVAPPKPPVADKPKAPAEKPLEVTEDDIKAGPKDAPPTSNFDAKIDSVLANITISDVVAKLEDLSKIFKTREVPRQLAIVDMMLDSLGLASYFPSLSEATNKALDSNNYISTRVEDILSKLRGAMGTNEVDLKGGPEKDNPEVAGIKSKLQSDQEKEKARKQMRKDQETAELENANKETPEVEVEEDLAPPAPPAAPPKAPPA